MFNKKCPRCKNKVSRGYDFCPYCSYPLKRRKEEDKGLIDKDLEEEFGLGSFGLGGMGFGGFPFEKILNGLTRELDRQFREIDKHFKEPKTTKKEPSVFREGLSISISSSGNGEPKIKMKRLGDKEAVIIAPLHKPPIKSKKLSKAPKLKISKEEAEKIAKLPHAEPSTTVRRLSNKIIYEIDLPGVKEKDIIINKLQHSIEIKAFAKDKAFFKLIPVALPILDYYTEKGKLIIELKPEM